MAFRPVAAELTCVCKVAPWGGGSELGGGDEGCVIGGVGCVSGGGEGRGGEGVDGGASGGGAVDFGEGGEGVPAEMLPGGEGGGRTPGGMGVRLSILRDRARRGFLVMPAVSIWRNPETVCNTGAIWAFARMNACV